MTIALAMIFALVIWWASTVLIIYLDGLKPSTFKYSIAGATVVMAISLWGLSRTAADPSTMGAYLAFTAGLFAWGWQECSFYMGYVTGPRKTPCPENCRGWKHFGHAIQTSLYHELAIIASAGLVVALTWGKPNQIGTWTFMILWWMHQSAKLNVFLGVRNLNEEFLPEHLNFLKGFLNKRAMNLLFPFSVTISTVLTVIVAEKAFAGGATPFEQAGYSFLTAMMALAILEHWMLVLPMPAGALWSPGLKSRGATKPFVAEIVVGFLGAGKTTFLKRLLAEADPAEKTVVLVNDFGELGLDAGLLDGQGADVVELPNGCICCSLRGDVTTRLRSVLDEMKPDRVLIEPSGVADVASLVSVLEAPELKPFVRETRLWTVIDAGAFLADYARLHDYFAVQARLAPLFVINKIDLVTPEALDAVIETLTALNPHAEVLPARHGMVDTAAARRAKPVLRAITGGAHDHGHDHAHDHGHDHDHAHAHHGPDALGFENMSLALTRQIAVGELRPLLDRVSAGGMGRIERLKGLVESGDGWLKFDIAGGRVGIVAHVPRSEDSARVMIIGTELARDALTRAFATPADAPRLAAIA
jgi:putative photosynthetic complex assembly protein 2